MASWSKDGDRDSRFNVPVWDHKMVFSQYERELKVWRIGCNVDKNKQAAHVAMEGLRLFGLWIMCLFVSVDKDLRGLKK